VPLTFHSKGSGKKKADISTEEIQDNVAAASTQDYDPFRDTGNRFDALSKIREESTTPEPEPSATTSPDHSPIKVDSALVEQTKNWYKIKRAQDDPGEDRGLHEKELWVLIR